MEEAGVPVSDPAPPDSEGRHPSWLTSRVVGISSHAVRRYQERVGPYLDSEQAKIAIYRLFEVAIFAHNAPRWTVNVSTTQDHHTALGWVIVEEDLAMPLRETRGLPTSEGHLPFQPFYVVTVLARLGYDGEWRNTRNLP